MKNKIRLTIGLSNWLAKDLAAAARKNKRSLEEQLEESFQVELKVRGLPAKNIKKGKGATVALHG